MKKLHFLALTLLLISGLFTACNKTNTNQSLRIGTMPTQTASIYAVGIEKGIFKKHNIDLKLTVFASAIERDSAATSGQLDGFLTDIMGAVNLKAHHFDYKITSSEYENFCLLVNEASKASSQLKIGVANNTVTEYLADTLETDKVIEKINVPKVPERLASTLSNTINGGVFPEPFVSILLAKKGLVLASSAKNNLQPVVFVFDEKYIKEHKDIVKGFYEAYNETVQYMKKSDYSSYKAILVQYKIITPELVDVVKLPLEQYSNAKQVSEEDLKSVQDWMLSKKMIDKVYPSEELLGKGLFE